MQLYVNIWKDDDQFYVNVETLVIIHVFQISNSPKVFLNVKEYKEKPKEPLLQVNLSNIDFNTPSDIPTEVFFSKWPVILYDRSLCCGLCSVSRQIVRHSDNEDVRKFLGFREACLVACAENSIWTKFCEVDIIKAANQLLLTACAEGTVITIPEDVLRYERHLSKPVKIHNIYKIARENNNKKSLQSNTPRELLDIQHCYAEGPYIALSDIILYPCFKIFFDVCSSSNTITEKTPLTWNWFNKIQNLNFPGANFSVPILIDIVEAIEPLVEDVSLYKTDTDRNVSVKHTKQYKIDEALTAVENLTISNGILPFGYDTDFSWENVPLDINPRGGALPQKRAARKSEQLENLVRAVVKLAQNKKLSIVDFCSGSGHLGLLLAYLLPQCQIILVENKEKSLVRARDRVSKLQLHNVVLVQSNLDYFKGSFDIGVSLHACGVATDLVIEACVRNKASFVSCPCCYGSVKKCHQLEYPRSSTYCKLFKNCETKYFDLAHAADQTHDEENAKTSQGYLCMDVIDTDRKFYAEEHGYKVHLGKLQPMSCTNKNNLLVGVYTSK